MIFLRLNILECIDHVNACSVTDTALHIFNRKLSHMVNHPDNSIPEQNRNCNGCRISSNYYILSGDRHDGNF